MSDSHESIESRGPSATLERLEETLGYSFADRSLLENALRHSSYFHEHPDESSNERLEFLGDAVIGLVVGDLLFRAHPEWAEGDLTRGLHALVDRESLAELARRLGLGEHLQLGRTERQSAGDTKASILADAMEAVIGALYLDGGLSPVAELVKRSFADSLRTGAPRVDRDPKTSLQERVMAQRGEFPVYRLLDDSEVEGDEERFRVQVTVQGEAWGVGVGRSKRLAERAAAVKALLLVRVETEAPTHD